MSSRKLVCAIAFAGAIIASQASAEGAKGVPQSGCRASSAEVCLSRHGLTTPELHAQIVKAAAKVCRTANQGDMLGSQLQPACLRRTVRSTVEQVNDKALTAFNRKQSLDQLYAAID